MGDKEMFRFIKHILDYFKKGKQDIAAHQTPFPQDAPDFDNLPPGFTPVESYYDSHRIPNTMLDIGTLAKVLRSPLNEQISGEQALGVQAGCGHYIYAIDTIITPEWQQYGLGGICQPCAQEAAELLKRNNPNNGAITLAQLKQAQALSLYCTQCAGHCDGCRRRNLCLRHSQKFEDFDGRVLFLCPDCLSKAESKKFLKKTVFVLLSPIVDHNSASSRPQRGENNNDY
jgi:hypothetical protein